MSKRVKIIYFDKEKHDIEETNTETFMCRSTSATNDEHSAILYRWSQTPLRKSMFDSKANNKLQQQYYINCSHAQYCTHKRYLSSDLHNRAYISSLCV